MSKTPPNLEQQIWGHLAFWAIWLWSGTFWGGLPKLYIALKRVAVLENWVSHYHLELKLNITNIKGLIFHILINSASCYFNAFDQEQLRSEHSSVLYVPINWMRNVHSTPHLHFVLNGTTLVFIVSDLLQVCRFCNTGCSLKMQILCCDFFIFFLIQSEPERGILGGFCFWHRILFLALPLDFLPIFQNFVFGMSSFLLRFVLF